MVQLDKILPVTHVKKHLLDILKNMSEEYSTITITKNGKPVSIMMTPDRYDSLMETIEILADPDILKALALSADDFKNNRVYEDSDVWQG
ncbi:type II toxin-antitoxin system Phd/YefM family antitoxin [Thermodesulfobacteriota bacterium]